MYKIARNSRDGYKKLSRKIFSIKFGYGIWLGHYYFFKWAILPEWYDYWQVTYADGKAIWDERGAFYEYTD